MVADYRRKLGLFVLAVLMVGSARIARAQYPDYLYELGSPTFAVKEPVPMGFVNVANGNLHLEIPIPALPQRGGKSIVSAMVYDSRIWRIENFTSSENWEPAVAAYNYLGWQYMTNAVGASWPVGVNQPTASSQSLVANTCSSGGSTYYWYAATGAIFNSMDTTRRFPAYEETSNTCHTPGTETLSGPATDASGYLVKMGTSYGYPEPTSIIAPDGTQVYQAYTPSGTEWEDANGNFMNTDYLCDADSDCWINPTDTLGRDVQMNTGSYYYDYGFLQYYGPGNAPYTPVRSTSAVSINTSFWDWDASLGDYVTEFSGNVYPLHQFELPDGTSYTFGYESYGYGELASVTLPTGDTVSFTYTNFTDAQGNENRWLHTVTEGSGTWTYTPATCGTNCQTVTVTRPSGDDTVYTFTLNSGGAWNTQTVYYTGSASSGVVAKTVTNTYDFSLTDPVTSNIAFTRPTSTATSMPGPSGTTLVKESAQTYDTFTFNYQGTNYTGSRGNVLTSSQYAFGNGSAGGLIQEKVYTYLHDSNSSYITPNIVNRVTDVQTKDGSGTKIAETATTYDSTSLTSITGVTHHDDTDFGTSYTLRGNPTVVQNWVSGSTYLSTTNYYDTTGQLVRSADPAGNTTDFSYSDSWASGSPPTTVTSGVGGQTSQLCSSSTYGMGYPVLKVDEAGKKAEMWTDALGRVIEGDEFYGGSTGTLGTCYKYDILADLTEVDQGSQTRSFSYDGLSRLTSETTPEAGTVNPAFPFWKRIGNLLVTANVNVDAGSSIRIALRRCKPNG